MDKKNLWLIFSLVLVIVFFVNLSLNLLSSAGNSPLVFLGLSLSCILFAYYSDDRKSSNIFSLAVSIIMVLFIYFSDIDIQQELAKNNIPPTFMNYLIVISFNGIKNFNLKKLLIAPGVVWYIVFDYVMIHLVCIHNRNYGFIKRKLTDSMREIRELKDELDKSKDVHKAISDYKNKIVEISSRHNVLKDFASEIGSSLEPVEIFDSIIVATKKLLDAKQSMLLVFDKNRKLRIKNSYNVPDDMKKNTIIDPSEGIIGMIVKNNSLITSENIEKNFQLAELHKMDKVNIEIAAPITDEGGRPYAVLVINKMNSTISKEHIRMFSILLNISALSIGNAKLYKKVEFLANVDGLTKLYTHRYFQEFLSEEIARAGRYKRPLSIIMSDIDHFKNFNDRYGHQTGDMVLENTARIFKASVRNKVDLVARYGGEEFIAVLPETDMKHAYIVAERLRKNIERAEYKGEKDEVLKVTASLGIASFPVHSSEKIELIKKADTALYYAKENGRNQVRVFDNEKMKIVEE